MKENLQILELENSLENREALAMVIQKCHVDVAVLMNLNTENCPSSPAFIDTEKVNTLFQKGLKFYQLNIDSRMIGTVALERSKDNEKTYYIEKLGVLPEYRHLGYGKLLIDFCLNTCRKMGANKISIAIINEHTQLKNWYLKLGFKATRCTNFAQLPFEVCFMEINLKLKSQRTIFKTQLKNNIKN